MQEYEHVTHTFEPIFNKDSKVLILGSFPSVKSRENNFLLEHYIAVWDVIESCEIVGSSDSSIKDVKVNDFSKVLDNSAIDVIYVNGGKAYELYHKYAEPVTGRKAIKLPSTSPANAAWNVERLCTEWKKVREMKEE